MGIVTELSPRCDPRIRDSVSHVREREAKPRLTARSQIFESLALQVLLTDYSQSQSVNQVVTLVTVKYP